MTGFDVGGPVRAIADGRVPRKVDEWARGALEDTLAALVGGTVTPLYKAAVRAAVWHPGPRPAIDVPGGTSTLWAAHLGAVAASALDADDGHYRGGGIHAGSTVVPVLLSGAGHRPLRELLHALVAGYEVAIRAGLLASPARTGESYRASGYAAAVGAAAALAAARGGSPDVIAAAARTAFAQAPHARMTSSASRESIGWAAASAVAAVELAEAGFGTEADDRSGHPPAGPTPFDEAADDPFVASLGADFLCTETYVKPWPSCRAAHAMLEALLDLVGVVGTADDITRIDVTVIDGAASLDLTHPRNLGEAQYALPWLGAVALLRGVRGLQDLAQPDLYAPDVVDLASRIQLRPGAVPAPEGGYPADASITLASGDVVRRTVTHALGSRSRPLSPTALEHKHTRLFDVRLDARRTKDLRDVLDDPSATGDDVLAALRSA